MVKNSNKFDLNKTTEKKFDLNKGNERKFDLTKENGEPEVIPSTEGSVSRSKNKFPYIVGALVIIAILVWGLFKYGGGELNDTKKTEILEVVDKKQFTSTDSVASIDDVVPVNVEKVSDENTDTQPTSEPTKSTEIETKTSTQNELPKQETSSSATTTSIPSISNIPLENKVSTENSSIEQKALQAIRGEFGNGQKRKDYLGAEYNAVQQRVNEMYRQGLVD